MCLNNHDIVVELVAEGGGGGAEHLSDTQRYTFPIQLKTTHHDYILEGCSV
jgi:hypothetical protein